jgi:UbiD family decarboxylase
MSVAGTTTGSTPYRDMRDFVAALESKGKLRRIRKEVDHTWELACIARWMYQALPPEQRFGLLFENVKGSSIPVMTGVLGASPETYAVALQTTPEQVNQKWVASLRNPLPPRVVHSAASQEVVYTGDAVDLGRFPIPIWTPGKDAAPYLTCITISKDADSGVQNMSTYRTMVKDRNHVAVNIPTGRHGNLCYESYMKKGKPAPFAWVVAAEPVVHFAAVANVPYGTDEMVVAGGLKGTPIDVVKAKTQDLLVPANAEFIIEGEFRPGDHGLEGPFGEFAGYMGPVADKPVATITAITHRRNPMYYGYISQMPPSESVVIQSLSNSGLYLKMLYDLGYNTVKDFYIDFTYGGLLAHGIVSMKQQYPGHAKRVGRCVANETSLKRVTVVDDDVDIRDTMHMDWALNSRVNAQHDVLIIDNVFTSAILDPTVRVIGGETEPSSKLVIDATEKAQAGSFSIPPKELMMKALESWKQCGLPEFKIPKRTQLILDHK